MNAKKKNTVFAVIYRAHILPEKEAEYVRHWKLIASYFVAQRGALGSTLHKTDEGMWVAYSKWPDKATRDASWPKEQEKASSALPTPIRDAIEGLRRCLNPDRTFPEICMELVEEISSPPCAGDA